MCPREHNAHQDLPDRANGQEAADSEEQDSEINRTSDHTRVLSALPGSDDEKIAGKGTNGQGDLHHEAHTRPRVRSALDDLNRSGTRRPGLAPVRRLPAHWPLEKYILP